jgi:hypothetical protein
LRRLDILINAINELFMWFNAAYYKNEHPREK